MKIRCLPKKSLACLIFAMNKISIQKKKLTNFSKQKSFSKILSNVLFSYF